MKKYKHKLFPLLLIGFLQVFLNLCFAKEKGLNIPHKPYNVVIISIDTLRADHLGCYGYYRDTSPNIDKLAKDGILFEQAIAQANWTVPSHSALFTSKYLVLYGAQNFGKLSDSEVTLAELLKAQGYKTAAFTGRGDVSSIYGFNQGFDVFDEGTADIAWSRGFKDTVPLALNWIKENKNDKFFVFLHGYDMHEPYRHPNKDIFDPGYKGFVDNVSPNDFFFRRIFNFHYLDENNNIIKISQRDIDHIVAHYDSGIRYVDAWIGEFFQGLKKDGVLENTIIIILSDHGEEFGERGIIGRHKGSSYDEVIHVPLIIKYPHSKPGRIKTQAQLIDVMPTILDFLNVPKNNKAHGNSLLPLIGGKADPSFNKFVYSSSNVIRSLKWKAVFTSRHELYDLESDPKEKNNLVMEKTELFLRLYVKLLEWRKESEEKPQFQKDWLNNGGYW